MVPARSGSKGIPHKNMRRIGGVSLIGRSGITLGQVPFLDARVISTDSEEYAAEARRYGLEAPFLRPPELSGDRAGAVETLQHALHESERHFGTRFDVVLIIEPTSPLRTPDDLAAAVDLLLDTGADSVVTVSPTNPKFLPLKALTLEGDRLRYFETGGERIVGRQQILEELYWRDGVCYALTRDCLVVKEQIITSDTVALVTQRPVVNIDEPIELEWAEFLLQRQERTDAAALDAPIQEP